MGRQPQSDGHSQIGHSPVTKVANELRGIKLLSLLEETTYGFFQQQEELASPKERCRSDCRWTNTNISFFLRYVP